MKKYQSFQTKQRRMLTSKRGRSSSTDGGGSRSLFPASRSCSSSSLSEDAIGEVCEQFPLDLLQPIQLHSIKALGTNKSKGLKADLRQLRGCFLSGK